MGIKSDLLKEIENFLPFIDEEFIVGISNKGIYKRSIKDLEKIGEIEIEKAGEGIRGKVEDNIVDLNLNLQKSRCSCPSASICKHIVMTLLYLKKYYDNNKIEEETLSEKIEEKSEEDFKELKELTAEKVLEILGKKNYNSYLKSILIRNEVEFQEGEMYVAYLFGENVKVFFPKKNSIENAMCSCKERGLCSHKMYALVGYLMKEGKIGEEDYKNEVVKIGEKEEIFFESVKEFIGKFLDKGLMGVMENEITTIEKFYIQAYNLKLYTLAEELKNLSSDLALYFSRNTSFSSSRILHTICLIYNRSRALSKVKDTRKLISLVGNKDDEKFKLNRVNLIGLGASSFLTKRGDIFLNTYFYCEDIKSILTMGTLRPYTNKGDLNVIYNSGVVWSNEWSFLNVSKNKWTLKDAKISEGKISSSKNIISSNLGETTTQDIEKIAISDFNIIKMNIRKHKFDYFEPYNSAKNIFLVKVKELKNMEYDSVGQKLRFDIFDEENMKIEFSIKYNVVSENVIKYIENNGKEFEYILGSINEKKGELFGIFLSGFGKYRIKNILG